MVQAGTSQVREQCDKKLRLAHLYNTYAAQYSRSVQILHKRVGVVSKAGYDELVRSTEEARAICEKARRLLEGHVAEHGC
jgi:hypothetical protein